MRGYNRNKADLKSYVSHEKSREQVAEHVAAGFPSPVEYTATVADENGQRVDATPVNLRRAPGGAA